ncbi:MAG: ATP-dependent Clp protease ATP-binding subunit ClpA, partial [Gammaproteobacteria bacterium]|nr:ATP-dependent Clp protease ATP-binding subunit ClpA [Gammaproteobacteria bacterium]
MLDKELEHTLNQAFREARGNNHEFMTVEHLLLALLDNNISREILLACGANISGLKTELNTFLQETVPLLPPNDDRDTQPTLGFQRVLQRAVFHVQSSGKQEVSAANVLVAIFSEQESQAVFFLKKQDINRLEVVNYLSHGISRLSSDEDMDEEIELGDDEKEAATKNPLTEYTT